MRYVSITLALAFLACLTLVPAERPAGAADNEKKNNDNQAWGTIKGQVVFDGEDLPAIKMIAVNKDKQHCLGKGPLASEDWVINKKNKGVRWVFVWLAPEPGGAQLPIHPSLKKVPAKDVVLDQPRCQFVPHCIAVREGQKLQVKNSAPISHNVRWVGHPLKNRGGSIIIPPRKDHVIDNLKAQKLPLSVACDIHGWMKGWIAVFDHPYYAVTDDNGKFEIKNAPAGKYRLMVWQESVGWLGGAAGRDGQKITIKAGGVTDLKKLALKPDTK